MTPNGDANMQGIEAAALAIAQAIANNGSSLSTGYVAPTFQNGWSDYDTTQYNAAAFARDRDGFVHIKGLVKGGTIGNFAIFTLPVGYRPDRICGFVVNSNSAFGVLQVTPAGIVQCITGNNAFVYVDGVSFKAVQ